MKKLVFIFVTIYCINIYLYSIDNSDLLSVQPELADLFNLYPYQSVISSYQDKDGYYTFVLNTRRVNNCSFNTNLIIENGFYRINYEPGTGQFTRGYMLFGKGIRQSFWYYHPYDWDLKRISEIEEYFLPVEAENLSVEGWHTKKYTDINKPKTELEDFGRIVVYNEGIDNITASSFLVEKANKSKIYYGPSNLQGRFYWVTGPEPITLQYDTITPPWVEGVPGYGVGEWLDVTFKYKSDELQILNGYVDFRRMYLYKVNSRVKTILVESENPKFSREYEFDDIVKYTVISLPQKTDHIKITIKDVYPGDKYDDTCLSSILVTNPDLPSFEERQEKMLQLMKDAGIWDKILEFKKQQGILH